MARKLLLGCAMKSFRALVGPISGLFLLIMLLCPPGLEAESTDEKLNAVLNRLFTAKKYDEAIELCDRYLVLHERRMPDASLGLLFGKVYLKSDRPGDLDKAARALRWAYVTDDRLREEGLYYYSESFLKRGFLDEAVFSYERFLKEFPRSVYADSARLNSAEALIQVGRIPEGVRAFRSLLDTPGFVERALLGLVRAHAASNDYETAGAYLDRVTRERPEFIRVDPDALLAAARTEHARGRLEEARYYADLLAEQYPGSVSRAGSYLVMAEIMIGQKRISEAVHYYEQAAQIPETAPEAGLGLMRLASQGGNYQEAIDRGERILTDYPYFERRKDVAMEMARAFEASGRLRDALDYFAEGGADADVEKTLLALRKENPQEFLDAYPHHRGRVQYSMEIGEALVEEGQMIRDASVIFKNLLLGAQQDRALRNLARAYQAMGFEGLARDFLADLIKRGVRDDAVFRVYGGLTLKVGRYDAAYSALVMIRDKVGEDWYQIGRVHEASNRKQEALNGYGQAIELGHAEAHLARAELLRKLGRLKQSLPDYRRASEACADDGDRLWATYQAARISGSSETMKTAADWGPTYISSVASVLNSDFEFHQRHGGNRALK